MFVLNLSGIQKVLKLIMWRPRKVEDLKILY